MAGGTNVSLGNRIGNDTHVYHTRVVSIHVVCCGGYSRLWDVRIRHGKAFVPCMHANVHAAQNSAPHSLKARKTFLCFEGMLGIDGQFPEYVQCRS